MSALHRSLLADGTGPSWRAFDGTLVFADISGFTPLAERLARRGKVGAEALTETLNLVFTGLLEVAGAQGGDCCKFGGDALLLCFTGDGHRDRGVAAAHGMQDALRGLRQHGGREGLARLGMSIGVHSGEVLAVLAGRSHQELLLVGPAVSRTLELEAAASAGEVLVGDPLEGPGPVLPAVATPADATAAADLVRAIPEGLRPHLDGSAREGEHRLAAVAFLKVSGTDALLDAGGPAPVADALHRLVDSVQRSCALHGTTFVASDVDRDGGKLVLAAGVPSTSSDDEDRILLTARSVVEATEGLPLALRIGLHRGRVFAVDLGSPARRTFTVMGDAVNLAARVMGAAAPGEVLATDDVVDRRLTELDLRPVAPFAVKGKSEPVQASVVGPVTGRRVTGEAELPMVGRERELATIVDACAAVDAGRGRVVELVGEPGIGKSRLLAAATGRAHGLLHFRFEGGRYSLASPYFALRRGLREAMGLTQASSDVEAEAALREVVERAAPSLAPWIPLLAVPLGIELPDTPTTAGLDAERRRETLHEAVVALMAAVLSTPTLITVEDAHWLDAASSDLLVALLAHLDRRPWAVIATRRPVEGGLDLAEVGSVERLELEPLGPDALLALAASVPGAPTLPPGTVAALVERSGGNPLFLQELVTATVAGSVTELPDTVEAVVAATIDTLPAEDRSLLRHASVLGGQFGLPVLRAMLDRGSAELVRALRRLDHFLGLAEDGTIRFRHILLRDAAYEGLPFRVRRALHARAGAILEAGAEQPESLAELLALHFHRAADHAAAWRYARIAAERARHNGASVEAAGFFDLALDAAPHLAEVGPAERALVAEQLGDACELSGRYERASAAYLLARRLAGPDAPRRAGLCRKLGYVRDHEGRYEAAQRWFGRGLAELVGVADRPTADRLWAELTTAAVSSRVRQGRHRRVRPMLDAAIRSAEASGDAAALAHAYFVLDQVLVDQGRYTEARHSERAAEIYESLGDDRGAAAAYNEVGNTAYWLGRWDDAVASYERAIEADRRAGALVYLAIYFNNIGEIRSDQGRWAEARSLLEEASSLWTGGGWRIGSGWALSNLGRLAAREGRFEDAAEQLDRAVDLLGTIGADAMLLETEVRQMELLVLMGDHGAALGVADPLEQRAAKLGVANVAHLVRRTAGYAWAQAGFPEQGWEHLETCLASCRKVEAEHEVALTLEAMERVGVLLGRGDLDVIAVEREAIFARLGVVATPAVPLPARPRA